MVILQHMAYIEEHSELEYSKYILICLFANSDNKYCAFHDIKYIRFLHYCKSIPFYIFYLRNALFVLSCNPQWKVMTNKKKRGIISFKDYDVSANVASRDEIFSCTVLLNEIIIRVCKIKNKYRGWSHRNTSWIIHGCMH